jgi:TPP-dependent pyruvate/acetoin dehydrogenase alpha subunit
MIAELYGKATGCGKGKGGSMHLIDVAAGMMGTSAVVGTTIPHAVGYAYAMHLRHTNIITAAFFGDGAVDEGVFHESINFAALKKLPMLFICENNFYSIHSRQLDRQPLANIVERARANGVRAERIEDGDVLRIHAKAQSAVDEIRQTGSGPWFFECMVYRWKEHVGPHDDFNKGYRSREEAETWFQSDPVRRLGALLMPDVRVRIEAEVDTEIQDAFAFAEASPFPDESELYTDMFKEAAPWSAS